MLTAVSPIDGRYSNKTSILSDYFSEFALIKYRIRVEVLYLKSLKEEGLPQLTELPEKVIDQLIQLVESFTPEQASRVKSIEATTNHDVKAVEYFIKEEMDKLGASQYAEFVHFGLTSQDINNTSFPLMVKDALENVLVPTITRVLGALEEKSKEYKGIPMLARTHGQPASPTSLGKEIDVFIERIKVQMSHLTTLPIKAKFGGATGNFNAHKISYSAIDWISFGNKFVTKYLGLERSQKTTQIAHYDHLAAIFDSLRRINVILIDFCRDIWAYISMEYFGQRVVKGEIGSSAMPHKVNPIDFENAEGNLGMANAILDHLSNKLPISRLQRDLTDSTVLRNIGVPFGHMMIAYTSILKGMTKLLLREEILRRDLNRNWAVVAEAIQNILRREGFPKPYEALKELTRGNTQIDQNKIREFINHLNISKEIKEELLLITPHNYIGYS